MTQIFTPTRAAALERLAAFIPKAGRAYAARRNFDLGAGAHAHVSLLSPYLRCRLITEEEVLQSVVARHGQTSAEKFIQEVYWRTYWKGWLEQRPGVWSQYQQSLKRAWDDVQTQGGMRAQWEAACTGDTGIDCFDAWAQELVKTGYLHNHARMWFASIWVFTLDLPWELGADFFLRHLLDGDPASNTLGWRWVAGIQTPGKTYLARTSNISKFTEGRFHPKWQLASEAVARPGPPVPPAQGLRPSDAVTANKRTGFLLHEEDLSPGFALTECAPVASAVLQPQMQMGPLHAAPMISEFRGAALDDASARWGEKLGPLSQVQTLSDIADWAKTNDLEQVVTPYAPTGAVAELLAQWRARPDMPALRMIMRPYDSAAWPFATRGFFPFKKHIPALLEGLTPRSAA